MEELENAEKKKATESKVKFFSLKNDGDTALVRFDYDTSRDFEIYRVHPYVDENGRTKFVNCKRAFNEEISKCPMCANGDEVRTKFYVKLLKYEVNDGEITATPMIWDRSYFYAKKLKLLSEEYGTPLKDNVYKIKRCGVAGSRETTYEIMYVPQNNYPEAVYKKDFTDLDNFDVMGTFIKEEKPETTTNEATEDDVIEFETDTTTNRPRRY